jgi:quinol monooxygenase YgiN
MTGVRYPVVELRQYTLHPGRRDELIGLFERELIEPQEAAGMAVVGQFRDVDDPDRFVWVRGFPDMAGRAGALRRFYGGPVWRAHCEQANATMIDSDNVLLLRPAGPRPGFPAPAASRPPASHGIPPPSRITATLCYRDRPFDEAFTDFFASQVGPVMNETGAPPLACLRTEHAENTYPALPVRSGENVFVWFSRFADAAALRAHRDALARCGEWGGRVRPALLAMLTSEPQQLTLAPTPRSLLR